MSKKYYIFAGVNGAGKSTLYMSDYLSEGIKELPYINADNILRTFTDDWKSAENQMKSGRMAKLLYVNASKNAISKAKKMNANYVINKALELSQN